MIAPVVARQGPPLRICATLLACGLLTAATIRAQGPDAVKDESTPGQFFTIVEPITHETITRVRAATRSLVDKAAGGARGRSPILIFQFLPGDAAPGTSDFGASFDLANYIAKDLGGAKLTVAYVPEPLSGYAVLPAIACTELVMASRATLGPITPENQAFDLAFREPVRFLAVRKTRDPDLILGMLDRDADLRLVRTADKGVHYILAEHLPDFLKANQVVDDRPAWEGGRRGVLTADRAREDGFSKRVAETPADVAHLYRIDGQSTVDDPTLGRLLRPVWIKIEGPIEAAQVSYMGRRIEQARREQANLVFFEFDSPGGLVEAADAVADLIVGIDDMKTVAYVGERALGVSSLLPLACRDIVFKQAGQIGDVRQFITARGRLEPLSEAQLDGLAEKAAFLAGKKGHPEAVARAMIDAEAELVEALDQTTGAARLLLRREADSDRDRFLNVQTRKEPGQPLTITGEDAPGLGLGQVVRDVEELKALYGLQGVTIRVEGPGWVDSLVTLLTDPYVSWMLLFVGLFMMVLELKLPGIGLPAIVSALAFMLFFWSHYLSGTADQLEIILFLMGLMSLAVELFVLPGFGVFGMSGIVLMLASIVMASHTFTWPTQEYEYREMGLTLIQLTLALLGVTAGGVVLAHYFPAIPIFNRLILKPEPWTGVEGVDPTIKPSMEGYESLTFLIGETGRTTSPLRPTGKARFGNMLVDVTADNFYIEPDSLVEVVDVQGTRITVKKWSGPEPESDGELDADATA
ncbi:NfeD family protein [Paludisphaera mucosa]|uniref:NfeD family protein n=1 Tax=Paludisphaera mucosa TaxID=3030827 RepID=A0ABT6F5W8_9BACT|nr:NfeD family protein [Paludisphaera mucosa]MDG3002976.1 NfeD family protein [Paludisphaera mucosa]